MKVATVLLAAVTLAGCVSYSVPRYAVAHDNAPVIRGLSGGSVAVDHFTAPKDFDPLCRGAVSIDPPVNMTYGDYVRTALADEFKVAGLYDPSRPQYRLSGSIEQMGFSSTAGEWRIGLAITSTNGKIARVTEHYQFDSVIAGDVACRRIADTFPPTVQNLIAKLIRSADFRALVGSTTEKEE